MFENMSVKFKFDAKMNLIDKKFFRIKKHNESNINRIHFQS